MKVTLRVPQELLTSKRRDLVMLLRIGAGVNAMEATNRMLAWVPKGDSSAIQLGRVHLFLAAVAYLREIVKTIENERYDERLFELVEKGAPWAPLPVSIADVRPLLSSKHPEIGGNVLLKIRDRVAFHWDSGPFASWLDIEGPLDLWTVDGELPDRVFAASAQALGQFVSGVPVTGTTVVDLIDRLYEASLQVGSALESAFVGLVSEVAADPRRYLVRD
jgi:hypothetical protein